MAPYQTKIVPPRLHHVVNRERLFQLLDDLRVYPLVWISSPAGSGKTTLVASYAKTRGIPVLWYSIDETDNDLASFFYHMGQAAKKLRKGRNKPLPYFTRGYRPGISVFTRRYFESLFGRMPPSNIVVLDNYQNLLENSEIQNVFNEGFRLIPEKIRVFVVSRREPPALFVSLEAESLMSHVRWDDIRLNLDEVGEILRLRTKEPLPDRDVQLIYEKTRGWAAGIILATDIKEDFFFKSDSFSQKSISDYFHLEVFDKFDESLKKFLIITALLPTINPDIARPLTGHGESAAILEKLSRNNFFTERYNNDYVYHPLFRAFLLSMARKSLSREEIREIAHNAGLLLVAAGQNDQAIDLLVTAGDWETLATIILGQAQSLLAEGRIRTLEKWITAIPTEIRLHTPWLLYWHAVCKQADDPVESLELFKRSLNLFKEIGETAGMFLAFTGIINSISLEYRDLHRLDRWIEWFDDHTGEGMSFPSVEIEAVAAGGMASSLLIRKPYHPHFRTWVDRSYSVTSQIVNPSLRMLVFRTALQIAWAAYPWLGDHPRWAELIRETEGLVKTEDPFLTIGHYIAKIAHLNQCIPGHESAVTLVQKALSFGKETGMIAYEPWIVSEGFYAAIYKGDFESASRFLEDLGTAPNLLGLVRIRYHACSCLYHLLKGNLQQSVMHGQELLEHSRTSGGFFPEAVSHLYLAFVFIEANRLRDAEKHLIAYRAMPETPSRILKFTQLIAEAALALCKKAPEAPEILKEALELGKSERYVGLYYWWQPSVMLRICKAALVNRIEIEYVHHLIRARNLIPEEPSTHLENWPWPVIIYTFGGFQLLRDGVPVVFSRKVQKRPLQLLKAIIVLGGTNIGEEALTELLWPDAEGDAAHNVFTTTLSRLRHLIGHEKAILSSEGKISLDRRYVFVDTWALEAISAEVEARRLDRSPEKTAELGRKAITLYKGHFLASDDEYWVLSPRERLRNRFLRLVANLGGQQLKAGLFDDAIEFYQRGLEVDDLSEEFYQRLMACYRDAGKVADALAVYFRCKNTLSLRFGIQPSPKTQQLYKSIKEMGS